VLNGYADRAIQSCWQIQQAVVTTRFHRLRVQCAILFRAKSYLQVCTCYGTSMQQVTRGPIFGITARLAAVRATNVGKHDVAMLLTLTKSRVHHGF